MKSFYSVRFLLALLLLSILATATGADDSRPNILWIVSEDSMGRLLWQLQCRHAADRRARPGRLSLHALLCQHTGVRSAAQHMDHGDPRGFYGNASDAVPL